MGCTGGVTKHRVTLAVPVSPLRVFLSLCIAALLIPTAVSAGSSWLILGKASVGDIGSIGYANNDEEFVSGAFDVGEHMAFRSLFIPAGLPEPRATGDILSFGSPRDPASLRLWDSETGRYEIQCPPDALRSFDWPCRIDFPVDHTLVFASHGPGQTHVDVLMEGADGSLTAFGLVQITGAWSLDPTDTASFYFEDAVRGRLVVE